jgi:hypothetical protein
MPIEIITYTKETIVEAAATTIAVVETTTMGAEDDGEGGLDFIRKPQSGGHNKLIRSTRTMHVPSVFPSPYRVVTESSLSELSARPNSCAPLVTKDNCWLTKFIPIDEKY